MNMKKRMEKMSNNQDIQSLELGEKAPLNLHNVDGNAFALLARARKAAQKYGLDHNEIEAEAMSGDYNNLLCVLSKYFEITI